MFIKNKSFKLFLISIILVINISYTQASISQYIPFLTVISDNQNPYKNLVPNNLLTPVDKLILKIDSKYKSIGNNTLKENFLSKIELKLKNIGNIYKDKPKFINTVNYILYDIGNIRVVNSQGMTVNTNKISLGSGINISNLPVNNHNIPGNYNSKINSEIKTLNHDKKNLVLDAVFGCYIRKIGGEIWCHSNSGNDYSSLTIKKDTSGKPLVNMVKFGDQTQKSVKCALNNLGNVYCWNKGKNAKLIKGLKNIKQVLPMNNLLFAVDTNGKIWVAGLGKIYTSYTGYLEDLLLGYDVKRGNTKILAKYLGIKNDFNTASITNITKDYYEIKTPIMSKGYSNVKELKFVRGPGASYSMIILLDNGKVVSIGNAKYMSGRGGYVAPTSRLLKGYVRTNKIYDEFIDRITFNSIGEFNAQKGKYGMTKTYGNTVQSYLYDTWPGKAKTGYVVGRGKNTEIYREVSQKYRVDVLSNIKNIFSNPEGSNSRFCALDKNGKLYCWGVNCLPNISSKIATFFDCQNKANSQTFNMIPLPISITELSKYGKMNDVSLIGGNNIGLIGNGDLRFSGQRYSGFKPYVMPPYNESFKVHLNPNNILDISKYYAISNNKLYYINNEPNNNLLVQGHPTVEYKLREVTFCNEFSQNKKIQGNCSIKTKK